MLLARYSRYLLGMSSHRRVSASKQRERDALSLFGSFVNSCTHCSHVFYDSMMCIPTDFAVVGAFATGRSSESDMSPTSTSVQEVFHQRFAQRYRLVLEEYILVSTPVFLHVLFSLNNEVYFHSYELNFMIHLCFRVLSEVDGIPSLLNLKIKQSVIIRVVR